ncbi:MAG: hypothetical protein MJ171_07370 [Clostridia bacterium]|nr:hypothetical protein [Clostridia bacterium]
MICEKCGTEMKKIERELSKGMECPNCGWGWITTDLEPILTDDTEYVIWLCQGNESCTSNIKLIAEIANLNYVQAKKLLCSNHTELLYKAIDVSAATISKAQRVQEIAKRLSEAGILFEITPDFPFEI